MLAAAAVHFDVVLEVCTFHLWKVHPRHRSLPPPACVCLVHRLARRSTSKYSALYALYLVRYPANKISFSLFKKLRPWYIRRAKQESCLCKQCENFKGYQSTLHSLPKLFEPLLEPLEVGVATRTSSLTTVNLGVQTTVDINISDALLFLDYFGNHSGSIIVAVDIYEDFALDLERRMHDVQPYASMRSVQRMSSSTRSAPVRSARSRQACANSLVGICAGAASG